MTRSTAQRLRLLAFAVGLSAAAGALYSAVQTPGTIPFAVRVIVGIVIGAAISSCIMSFALFVAERLLEHGGRRLPLGVAILVRTLAYGVVILAALLIVPWLIIGQSPSPLRPGIVSDVLFSVAATFVVVALTSVIQLIGPNVLGSLLSGRYHRPREEQRIVVFLDLVGSTAIAEAIGNVRFHALLAETFTRLARVVTDHGGEVHRYVGDALIATWPIGTAEDNARPILCLFACRDALETLRAELQGRHGHTPGFRASLHLGPLVVGEIGGFKREISLLGEAMNTAARIEQVCRDTGHALLASRSLVDAATMPAGVVAASIGFHQLRGKVEAVEVMASSGARKCAMTSLGALGAGDDLRRVDEAQRDQQPDQRRHHVDHRHRVDRLHGAHAGGEHRVVERDHQRLAGRAGGRGRSARTSRSCAPAPAAAPRGCRAAAAAAARGGRAGTCRRRTRAPRPRSWGRSAR